MGSKKSTTTSNQNFNQSQNSGFNNTAKYEWSPERSSGDIDALRGLGAPQLNQATDYAYGNQLSDIDKAFGNVTSAYGTPELDAQRKLSAKESTRQNYGQQKREDYASQYQGNLQRLSTLASLTAPQLLQTGSSGSSFGSQYGGSNETATQKQPGGGFWGALGGLAGGALGAFL